MPTAAMRLPRSAAPTLGMPRARLVAPALRRPAAALVGAAPRPLVRAPGDRRSHRRRLAAPLATTRTTPIASAAAVDEAAPAAEIPAPAEARPFYAGKRAVVVGAGPAGSAAAILLARQGFSVCVFDKRPEPRDDAVDAGRAYVIIAIPRGRKVLDELGVALGPEAEEALLRPARGNGEGKGKGKGAQSAGASAGGAEQQPPPPRAGTVRHAADGKVTSSREDGNVQLSRSALAQALIDAAREQFGGGQGGGAAGAAGAAAGASAAGGSIAFHFGWSAEGGVDLKRRRVTFTRTSGGDKAGSGGGSDWRVAPFDLLVGADGAASVVRSAFASASGDANGADADAGAPFSFDVEDTGREYKTYASAPGADPSTGAAVLAEPAGLEGAATLHLWRPKKSDRTGRWDRFASFTAHSNPDGTYSGTVALRRGGFAALEAKASAGDGDGGGGGGGGGGGAPNKAAAEAAYEAFLRDAYTGVPERWIPDIAAQLAAAQPRSAGRRVRCSRLCDGARGGGRAVLIGDAAHGVSPVFGQGMNSSLETASVLARALRECAAEAAARAEATAEGGPAASPAAATAAVDAALDAAPRRFDAERREDAHALVALDRKAFSFFGAGPVWDAFQLLAHVVVGSVLGRLAPWLYGRRRPALLSLGSPDTSYGAILRDVRRDAAALVLALVALAAWAAGKALRRAAVGGA
jgi:2-polyprenyl-6-methoxyphenol hydroxylase-like FAD-dependent oxidoreductase